MPCEEGMRDAIDGCHVDLVPPDQPKAQLVAPARANAGEEAPLLLQTRHPLAKRVGPGVRGRRVDRGPCPSQVFELLVGRTISHDDVARVVRTLAAGSREARSGDQPERVRKAVQHVVATGLAQQQLSVHPLHGVGLAALEGSRDFPPAALAQFSTNGAPEHVLRPADLRQVVPREARYPQAAYPEASGGITSLSRHSFSLQAAEKLLIDRGNAPGPKRLHKALGVVALVSSQGDHPLHGVGLAALEGRAPWPLSRDFPPAALAQFSTNGAPEHVLRPADLRQVVPREARYPQIPSRLTPRPAGASLQRYALPT